jgi:HlyD family secretion protein
MSRHRAQKHQEPSRFSGKLQSPAMLRAMRGSVAIALVASGVVACATSSAPPRPNTAPVQRTSITSGVSAAGSLASVTQQNLGFTKGGQLTAVDVKVGDRVTAGQVLATIDPFAAQQALDQARGQLTTQQATLNKVTDSPAVSNAQATLDQAEKILQRTKDQADAVQQADETAIDNARRQLSQAKKAQDTAEDQLKADQAACGSSSSSSLSSSGSSGASPTNATKAPSSSASSAVAAMVSMPSITSMTSSTSSTSATASAACAKVPSDQASVSQAKAAVVTAQNAVDSAKKQKDVDEENGRLAVANAQQGVVTAQNALNQASSDRPNDINAQSGQVSAAQAAVDQAQRDLDDTTLRAPVDGTVSAVNGTVGEFVAASSGTSALAPGSDAAIPGAGNGTGAASPAAAQGVASPTRPGGLQFLVLDNVDEFQIVASYSETDAAQIAAGQKVRLTFDAVPDAEATGSVLSVSPTATAISGVVSYYVTVVLPKGDPRLKSGMSAQAEVLTKEIPGVLAVPSAAVHTQNGMSVVTVLDPNGTQRTVNVQTGATGDGKTQILSGVTEGQQVVLPATP